MQSAARKLRSTILISLISALLLAQTVAAQEIVPPLSFKTLENANYQLPGIGSVSLSDGTFSEETVTVAFETSYIGGDLNEDGFRGDAAIILTAATDGAERHYYLIAMANTDGEPIQLGTTYLGRGLQIDSLVINGSDISVSYTEAGTDQVLSEAVVSLEQLQLPEADTALAPLPGVPVRQIVVFDLRFDPETGTAIVDGFMPNGGEHNYQLDGQAGQDVRLELFTRGDSGAVLSFTITDLATNLPLSAEATAVAEYELPRTGRYEITVNGDANRSARYTMVVTRLVDASGEDDTILTEATTSDALPTDNIEINSATGVGEITGVVAARGIDTYLIPVQGSQGVDIRLDIAGDISLSTVGEPVLEITDTETGEVITRSSERRQSATLTVEQNTILAVNIIGSGTATSYTLSVLVEPTNAPSPAPSPPVTTVPPQPQLPQLDGTPQRLQFAAGANAISVDQTVSLGAVNVYEIEGQQAQSLTLSTRGNVVLGITGPGNLTLLSPNSGVSSYTVTLPVTGIYRISVRSNSSSNATYTLTLLRSGSSNTYVVQPNDTLLEIAIRFNTTIDRLLALNNLSNPNLIFAGQVLELP